MSPAAATSPASANVKMSTSDLDFDDLLEPEGAERDHNANDPDHRPAGVAVKESVDVRGRCEHQDPAQDERRQGEHPAGHAALGCQGVDLAAQPIAFANRLGDDVEHLGHVPADLMLDAGDE